MSVPVIEKGVNIPQPAGGILRMGPPVIERGIPIPEEGRYGRPVNVELVKALSGMKVGDSFLWGNVPSTVISGAIARGVLPRGFKVASRVAYKEGKKIVKRRVWRIA